MKYAWKVTTLCFFWDDSFALLSGGILFVVHAASELPCGSTHSIVECVILYEYSVLHLRDKLIQ